MLRRFSFVFLLLLAWAGTAAAQSRGNSGFRARKQPKASEDVKLAPGMRLGRPLALTTDYMGRPLKPKAKLTSTPAKTSRGQATSMSARGAATAGNRTGASLKNTKKKSNRR